MIEMTTLFKSRFIKQQIISSRRGNHNSKTNSIGSIFVNQLQKDWRVAKTLAHFASLLITHHAREIYITEWFFFHEFKTCHCHSCNPKENNILPCYQNRSRVVVVYILITGLRDSFKY